MELVVSPTCQVCANPFVIADFRATNLEASQGMILKAMNGRPCRPKIGTLSALYERYAVGVPAL